VREYWPTAALTATVVLGISAAASLLLVIGTKFGVSYTPPPPSVADLGSLCRIRNFIYPGSQIQQQQGVGGICCLTFSCSHKFHKIENYFSYEQNSTEINLSHLTFYPSSQI
jgi:hypothetical protein